MSSINLNSFFVEKILLYYQQNKRNLPWRNTKDPYKIWISEIILQQTQVKQALNYYLKFIQTFPSVKALATAKEEEVLHLWQGLGYYSRARNLHLAAQQIMIEFNGRFPDNYPSILTLKGVGRYTAAAIVSIAFNQPYAVVDGNVYRVLSRFYGITIPIDTTKGKNYFFEWANQLIDKNNPSDYNQAIMEFGATCCKPIQPNCTQCYLSTHCYAWNNNKVNELPVKSKSIKKQKRHFNYLIFIENNRYTYIQKRRNNDIWKGLYEFYLIESKNSALSVKSVRKHLDEHKIAFDAIQKLESVRHKLSHQELFIQFFIVKDVVFKREFSLKKVALNKLLEYPYPVVIQKIIHQI